MQAAIERVHVARRACASTASTSSRATRASPSAAVGATPRGSLALLKLARCRAALRGRDFVAPGRRQGDRGARARAPPRRCGRSCGSSGSPPRTWCATCSRASRHRARRTFGRPRNRDPHGRPAADRLRGPRGDGIARRARTPPARARGRGRAVCAPRRRRARAPRVIPTFQWRWRSPRSGLSRHTDLPPMSASRRSVGRSARAVPRAPSPVEVVSGGAPAVRLRAREEQELPVHDPLRRRGACLRARRRAVRARDPFRIVTWEARPRARHAEGVPERDHGATPPRSASRRRHSPAARSPRVKGDGVEYADIRDFAPGDRVRAINWRASARRQTLVVNERHPERNTDVVLFVDSFVDVRSAGRSVARGGCEGRRGAGTRYLDRRDRVGLVGFGGVLRWLQPGMGSTQRYRLIETMLETGVEPTYTWRDVNVIPARILPPDSLVLALSPLVDPTVRRRARGSPRPPLRRCCGRGRSRYPTSSPAGPTSSAAPTGYGCSSARCCALGSSGSGSGSRRGATGTSRRCSRR